MKAAAWSVGYKLDRSAFYVGRCLLNENGQSYAVEELRGPSGRRVVFRSKEAAQARADALNGKAPSAPLTAPE